MKSLVTTLESIYSAFDSIQNLNVYHYLKPAKATAPYMVWAEDGEEGSFHTDNHKSEQVIGGTCDFFTQTEFDGLIDSIQDCLNDVEGLGWKLESVDYEDETKLIHYHWRWEVV